MPERLSRAANHTASRSSTSLSPGSERPGLYILDELESARSPTGQLKLLRIMQNSCAAGSQFVAATHSPVLMAVPHATIFHIDDDGLHKIAYDEVTRSSTIGFAGSSTTPFRIAPTYSRTTEGPRSDGWGEGHPAGRTSARRLI